MDLHRLLIRPMGEWLALTSALSVGCATAENAEISGGIEDSPKAEVNDDAGRPAETETESAEGAETPTCPVQLCGGANCADIDKGRGTCDSPLLALDWKMLQSGINEVVLTGDTACAETVRSDDACRTQTPGFTFALDLTGRSEPIRMVARLDAEFDASLRLEQGDCGDPFTLACNEDHVDGVDASVISETLDPGIYRLMVGPEAENSAGEFELRLQMGGDDTVCLGAPPANDRCEDAIALDPSQAVQTVVGSTVCAANDAYSFWQCHFAVSAPDVFYSLDLSERTSDTVLHASTDIPPTDFDTVLFVMDNVEGRCFAPVACDDNVENPIYSDAGSELITRLPPGKYFLGVSSVYLEAGAFGLSVSLDQTECAPNASCDTAIDLDPTAEEQVVNVNLACADGVLSSGCDGVWQRSDVFYRLDLSNATEPVVFSAAAWSDYATLTLRAANDAGTCGAEYACDGEAADAPGWLQAVPLDPGVYYLMVSAFPQEVTSAEMTLRLAPAANQAFEPCVQGPIGRCAQPACCAQGTSACLRALVHCGLDPALVSCVCGASAKCCGLAGTMDGCLDVFQQCGVLCADFDAAGYCSGSE